MTLAALLHLSLLVSSVLASPRKISSSPITLPIAVKINSTGGAQGLLERDRARFQALLAHRQAKSKGEALAAFPVPITDTSVVYVASVGVGVGTYSLVVDTGSSNTWIGAGGPYQPGPNSQDTGETVKMSYGSGYFSGEEYTDDVTLGPVTIASQGIGVASTSAGLTGHDGILGIGRTSLTIGSTSGGEAVPTVTDNLHSQGLIDTELVGISLNPTTSLPDQNGQLDFGGIDSSKVTGDITFVPVIETGPTAVYWGIEQSITYGPSSIPILSSTAGFVDTGTVLLPLATDAFQAYQQATGATFDKHLGLLTVPSESNLESLFFQVGGTTFEFTANAQMWPRALNSHIGGVPGQVYLIVADAHTPSGSGNDFVDGFTFLQRFYSIYDTTNSMVGLATTPHTYDTTN